MRISNITSQMHEDNRSSKKPFRQMVERQQLELIEKLKALNIPDPVKEYLIGIRDPNGKVFKAAYYSFPLGERARQQLAKEIADKYGVDESVLFRADEKLTAQLLHHGVIGQDFKEGKMAVVKLAQPVGSRIADIGPGRKEHNVKTDAAWRAAQKTKPTPRRGVPESGMPSGVIRNKQRLAHMSDQEFAEKYASRSDDELRQMAWHHGYGKMSNHYVEKRNRGSSTVTESDNYEETKDTVSRAISHRIMLQNLDLINNYGLDAVVNAIEDVASYVAGAGDLEEIGGSDISAWVNYVRSNLERDQKKPVDENSGFPVTPKYKVGDLVSVKGYQGIGKIAYIKNRADVGVIFIEPEKGLRVQTAIDDLLPH